MGSKESYHGAALELEPVKLRSSLETLMIDPTSKSKGKEVWKSRRVGVESSWMFEGRFYHPLTISLPVHFHCRNPKAVLSITGLGGISAVHYIEDAHETPKLFDALNVGSSTFLNTKAENMRYPSHVISPT